jgi:hypothetical protein
MITWDGEQIEVVDVVKDSPKLSVMSHSGLIGGVREDKN